MPAQSVDPGIDEQGEHEAVEGTAHDHAGEERRDQLEPRSSGGRGVDGADVPGGGNRESTWIGPARRHAYKRGGGGQRFLVGRLGHVRCVGGGGPIDRPGILLQPRQRICTKPVESSVVINRPLEACFAYLSDLANDVEWRREWIDAAKTSEGPHRVGARYRLTGALLGRRMATVYETSCELREVIG